ncbi:hypothetical protein DPV78_010805, partial [Talaromyces pinophilus]
FSKKREEYLQIAKISSARYRISITAVGNRGSRQMWLRFVPNILASSYYIIHQIWIPGSGGSSYAERHIQKYV